VKNPHVVAVGDKARHPVKGTVVALRRDYVLVARPREKGVTYPVSYRDLVRE
jgi:hypothetical protein